MLLDLAHALEGGGDDGRGVMVAVVGERRVPRRARRETPLFIIVSISTRGIAMGLRFSLMCCRVVFFARLGLEPRDNVLGRFERRYRHAVGQQDHALVRVA